MQRMMLFSLLFCIGLPVAGFAGVTGKIAGRVLDKKTGEPLPGANIVVEGMSLGASADRDGVFYILQVPPGEYSVRAEMIGYTTVIQKGVRVRIDLTTTIEFKLTESPVEGKEVVVTAERELIQKDVTSKISIVSSEEIKALPISNFRDALQIQGGFTDALHLRGGRSNQIGFMIDGQDVTNPLFGNYEGVQADRSATSGQSDNLLFAGAYVSDPNSSNYDGILLDKTAVEEVQVLTGTFNAEYGRAMSGIVNVVTKDPRPEYQMQFEYISPNVLKSPYREPDAVAIDERPGPNNALQYREWKLQDYFNEWDRQMLGQYRGNLSGAVPFVRNLTFLVSGQGINENSYLPFGYDIVREGFEKLSFAPPGPIRLSFTGQQTRKFWQPYNHDWKYLPNHYSHFERSSDRYSVQLTHTLTPSTLYTLKASRIESHYQRNVPGLKLVIDENASPNFDPIVSDYQQPERWENGFFYKGHDISIENSKTITLNAKLDLTSQLHPSHLVKAGVDLLDHDIRQFIYLRPYLGGVHEFQNYKRRPLEISAYIQDKIEYSYLIINLGVRMDYFNPNGWGKGYRKTQSSNYPFDDEEATMWQDLFLPGFVNDDGEFEYYPEQKAKSQVYLSPRIGVAHPVSADMVLHFAYGHFVQRPDFRDIFYSHDIQRNIQLAGNPNAKIQKTVAFEAGLKSAFGDLVALDISVYYRDIYDLLGTQFVNFFPFQYSVFNNSNYANAKGFEISLHKRYHSYFSANLNYTFLIARGNENTSRTGVKTYYGSTNDRLRPRRDFFLDWDRRHTIGGSVRFHFPKGSGPSFLGMRPLQNTSINMLFNIRSGLPYTPTERATGDWDFWLRILQTNTSRRPWTYQIDMDVAKDFRFSGINMTAFARITNVLNTENAQWVYTNTGRLWDAGPQNNRSDDFIRDPSAKGPPRQIRVGFRFNLNP